MTFMILRCTSLWYILGRSWQSQELCWEFCLPPFVYKVLVQKLGGTLLGDWGAANFTWVQILSLRSRCCIGLSWAEGGRFSDVLHFPPFSVLKSKWFWYLCLDFEWPGTLWCSFVTVWPWEAPSRGTSSSCLGVPLISNNSMIMSCIWKQNLLIPLKAIIFFLCLLIIFYMIQFFVCIIPSQRSWKERRDQGWERAMISVLSYFY